MKYIIGTFITFLLLMVAAYFILQIWGIDLINPENFRKAALSITITFILSIFLTIVIPFFFKNHAGGYNQKEGNVAHKKT